jgi:hypothetical protein
MQDVTKVEGPSGSPENPGKKDKKPIDNEQFKKTMQRITEVSSVDPDEQKKRKRREEAEEEQEPSEGPAAPASPASPFSLEEEPKKPSPLDMQGNKGIPPTESSQKSTLASPAPSIFPPTPSTDEMADDSGVLEEESFASSSDSEETSPPPPLFEGAETATALPIKQPVPQAPSPSPTEEMGAPKQQSVIAGPPETGQRETGQQQSGEKPPQSPKGPPSGKKGIPSLEPPQVAGLKAEQQQQTRPAKRALTEKGAASAAAEGAAPSKVETTGFFEQLGKGREEEKGGKKRSKTTEELEKETQLQEAAAVGPPQTSLVSAGEEKEEKTVEKQEGAPMEGMGTGTGTAGQLAEATPPAAPGPLPSYANLHPQVMEIFDRMVGVMTVMTLSGMTETTITLNAPQFASSVFFGTQIIIQEYSTAPQAFNIQLNGTPQAVALFQGNVDDLMAAFQASNYNFRVHRLETGYLTERPLFKRKEKAGDEKKDTGENQR